MSNIFTQASITNDDCDGNKMDTFDLFQSDDGDYHISLGKNMFDSIRIRTPFIGGGSNENTYNALKDLMTAMKKDQKIKLLRERDGCHRKCGCNTQNQMCFMACNHSLREHEIDLYIEKHLKDI